MKPTQVVIFTASVDEENELVLSDVLHTTTENTLWNLREEIFGYAPDSDNMMLNVGCNELWDKLSYKEKIRYMIDWDADDGIFTEVIIKDLCNEGKTYRNYLHRLIHSPFWLNFNENTKIDMLIEFDEWYEKEENKGIDENGDYVWWIKYENLIK